MTTDSVHRPLREREARCPSHPCAGFGSTSPKPAPAPPAAGSPYPIDSVREELSQHLLLLRSRAPFFSALALFARLEVSERFPTAATDGFTLFFNPGYFRSIRRVSQRLGLIVHELLHAALRHPVRTGGRDPFLWNVAADIVVNGIVARASGLAIPDGGLRDVALEEHSVEEVYARIVGEEGAGTRSLGTLGADLVPPGTTRAATAPDGPPDDAESVERHWRSAWIQAQFAAEAGGVPHALPADLERAMNTVARPELDWRVLLWRHLVRTPTDFEGYDHRFIADGRYVESLDAESLEVQVCIDTSGSIDRSQLTRFLGELRGILGAHPHLTAKVHSLDTRLAGPWTLDSNDRHDFKGKLRLVGGGGTDFRPFFAALESVAASRPHASGFIAVVLTDGYGKFPDLPPACDTLWVVTPGGLPGAHFPFGSVARLVDR